MYRAMTRPRTDGSVDICRLVLVVTLTVIDTSLQMSTDPAVRGRVMALYMMVFLGGAPVGAPIVGWVTDTYGARLGFAAGGAIAMTAAAVIGLVLARAGGLRLTVRWHHGHPTVRFVPRDHPKALAPAA